MCAFVVRMCSCFSPQTCWYFCARHLDAGSHFHSPRSFQLLHFTLQLRLGSMRRCIFSVSVQIFSIFQCLSHRAVPQIPNFVLIPLFCSVAFISPPRPHVSSCPQSSSFPSPLPPPHPLLSTHPPSLFTHPPSHRPSTGSATPTSMCACCARRRCTESAPPRRATIRCSRR